jgi:hypothetical protein
MTSVGMRYDLATLCDNCHRVLPLQTSPDIIHHDLINCYNPPDKSLLKNSITVLQADIDIYDMEIARIEALTRILRERRESLWRKSIELHNLLSPIRRLPADVLLEIFDILLEQAFEVRSWAGNEKSKRRGVLFYLPLLLAQVSSQLRCEVFRAKRLWTLIDLKPLNMDRRGTQLESSVGLGFCSVPYETASHTSCQYSLLKYGLQRSGSLPLDVSMIVHGLWKNATRCIGPLLSVCHRWGRLDIDCPGPMPTLLFWTISRNLSMLTHLTLTTPDLNIWSPYLTGKTQLFTLTPGLNTVSLEFGVGLDNAVLPWDQLYTIRFEDAPYNDVHKILRLCTNLKSAVFDTCYWSHDVFPAPPPSSLVPFDLTPYTTSVERLTVDLIGVDHIQESFDMFSIMTAPNLSSASLCYSLLAGEYEDNTLHPFVISFVDMISRSACPLTELEIYHFPIPSDTFLRMLRFTPQLTMFSYSTRDHLDQTFTKQVLDQMTFSSNPFDLAQENVLWPHLVDLQIHYPVLAREESDAEIIFVKLFWMLESRCCGVRGGLVDRPTLTASIRVQLPQRTLSLKRGCIKARKDSSENMWSSISIGQVLRWRSGADHYLPAVNNDASD